MNASLLSKALLFLAICCFSLQLVGQIEPIANTIQETWVDKVPVSGEIRTGILLRNDYCESLTNSYHVKIPDGDFDILGVEISSNDGRYNYRAEYNITNVEAGWVDLLRKTDKSIDKKLSNYKCNQLTILAWVMSEGGKQKQNFVLANWGPKLDSENVYVHLLSENPALIYITYKDGSKPSTLPCKQMPDDSNVAYNCECEIPMTKINGSASIDVIQRVRRSQNRYPLSIKL